MAVLACLRHVTDGQRGGVLQNNGIGTLGGKGVESTVNQTSTESPAPLTIGGKQS